MRYSIEVQQNHLAMPTWNHLNSSDMVFTLGLKPKLLDAPENVRQSEELLFRGARWFVGFDDTSAWAKTIKEKNSRHPKFPLSEQDSPPLDKNATSDNTLSLSANIQTISDNTLSLSANIQTLLNATNFGFKLMLDRDADFDAPMKTHRANTTEWPWPSCSYLELQPDVDWVIIGTKLNRTVLASRNFGKGTLIVSASSHWLCNQYLASVKPFDLLTDTVGEARRFTLDESQLGLVDDLGVIDLIMRYRLSSFFLVFSIIVWLLWWSGLVHRPSRRISTEQLVDHHESEGLKWILQRSLNPSQTLESIFSLWKSTINNQKHFLTPVEIEKLEQDMNTDLKNKKSLSQPLSTYNLWLARFRDKLHE
jgi:hypothetical protein